MTDRDVKLVRVGRTPLGRGVIAARAFRRNQTIAQIRGRLILDPDYGSDYCIDLGEGVILEPAPPFRYLNHCCEPNSQVYCWEDEDDKKAAWLEALRTIRPGEELTIDYGWSADAAIRCACGAPECRGWVVSREELGRLR